MEVNKWAQNDVKRSRDEGTSEQMTTSDRVNKVDSASQEGKEAYMTASSSSQAAIDTAQDIDRSDRKKSFSDVDLHTLGNQISSFIKTPDAALRLEISHSFCRIASEIVGRCQYQRDCQDLLARLFAKFIGDITQKCELSTSTSR
jgi:hypothetical protein